MSGSADNSNGLIAVLGSKGNHPQIQNVYDSNILARPYNSLLNTTDTNESGNEI